MSQRTESLSKRTCTLQKGARHLFLRADLYRILALGFDQPSPKKLEELAEVIGDLLKGTSNNVIPVRAGIQNLLKTLDSRLRGNDKEEIETEHNRLFATQTVCPPLEGNYLLQDRGPILGDITAFYQAFGLKFLSQEGPPDAIKMELGFLSLMALKEAYALHKGLLYEAQTTREGQQKFFLDHLDRWGHKFVERLLAATHHPYYQTLGKLLEVWLEMEKDYFLDTEGRAAAAAAGSVGIIDSKTGAA